MRILPERGERKSPVIVLAHGIYVLDSYFIHRKILGKGTNNLHRDSRYLVGFIIPYVLADRIVVLKAVHRAAAER